MGAASVFIVVLLAGVLAALAIGWASRGTRLEEGRSWAAGLPDLLMYASMIDDGIMLLQDGALVAAWRYSGPDLSCATHEEMAALADRLNGILKLGSSWVIQSDAIRTEVSDYAKQGVFPDAVTSLIDDERRAQFQADGRHFESHYYITLTFLPPLRAVEKVKGFLFKGGDENKLSSAETALATFKDRIGMFQSVLSSLVQVARLCDHAVPDDHDAPTKWLHSDLCRFIRRCVTGEDHPFTLPEIPVFLHDLIGNTTLVPGVEPLLGERHLQIIAIDGFPATSFPGILAALDTLPFEYRWNTRAILMDPEEAFAEATLSSKKWMAKARGFVNQLMNKEPKRPDHYALNNALDSNLAASEASSGNVQFAYYSGNIVLMDTDLELVRERARDVAKILRNLGFGARIETFNAVDAWRGTLPGDAYRNRRRVMLHTLNLADCMPIAAVWSGDRVNGSALMPKNSEPLMYATSTGSTVFRFNLHVGDLGHTLLVAPSGGGKSTLLCAIAAQYFRYPKTKVFIFDKDYSAWMLNKAAGGEFYDLGAENGGMSFAPFAQLDTQADLAWASEYIEQLSELAGSKVDPTDRKEIFNALQLLVQSETRTFTELLVNIQSNKLRDALRIYTLEGALSGLLEAPANKSILGTGRFKVFEMGKLMGMGNRAVCSTLLYLFRYVNSQLDGSPTAIIVDEAWKFLDHPMFSDFLKDWAKTLRKFNAVLIVTTQSLSDITKSALKDVLIDNCPTKIFGPNPEALTENARPHYEGFGLNPREIEILSRAIPKREYYVRTPNGRRLFSLGFGPVALSFIGVSSPEARAKAAEIQATYGNRWIGEWLRYRGVNDWADFYEKKYGTRRSGLKLVS